MKVKIKCGKNCNCGDETFALLREGILTKAKPRPFQPLQSPDGLCDEKRLMGQNDDKGWILEL